MSEKISVNGENRPWTGQSMADLLGELGIEAGRGGVAVALNADVVPRGRWGEVRPQPGDRIEIVHVVRGG